MAPADRTAKLREAIVKVLPIDWEDRTTVVEVVPHEKPGFNANVIWGHPERLADAIVAAVEGVLDEGETVEWAYRYPNGHVATGVPGLMTEQLARNAAADYPDLLTAVRRRVSEWEDA